jgi:type I restriction enzyme M protein
LWLLAALAQSESSHALQRVTTSQANALSSSSQLSKSSGLPSGDGLKPRTTLRDRRRETLFIDARKMGTRVHRELTAADLEKIVSTYHAMRGDSSHVVHASACSSPPADTLKREQCAYQDLPGFCKSATTAEIAAHGHVLTPGRYVGAEEVEDDGDPFEEKMPRLVAERHAQFAESAKLEQVIKANLRGLGYGG